MSQATFFTTPSLGRHAVVLARGEVDLATTEALTTVVRHCLVDGYATIGFDMRAVTFMDCSGVSAMIDCHVDAAAAGAGLAVTHPSVAVSRILRLASADWLLAG